MLTSQATKAVTRLLDVLPKERLSRTLGKLSNLDAHALSLDWVLRTAIDAYCRAYHVDLSDAEIPAEGFHSFDAFFTRTLRPGARPIDADPNTVVSPCDGKVAGTGRLGVDTQLFVKGQHYSLAALLEDAQAAKRYEGGWYALVYLSPRDYHRVHVPVDGEVVRVRHIDGDLFPVNRLGMTYVPGLFCRNKRVVVEQNSAKFGTVTSLMVGAVGVGEISLSFDTDRDRSLHKGDELGIFHMGSTVVLVLEKADDLTSSINVGDTLRMGQRVVTRDTHD